MITSDSARLAIVTLTRCVEDRCVQRSLADGSQCFRPPDTVRRVAVFPRRQYTDVFADNEELVGKAIRESGIPRSEIFLTSKLPCVHTIPPLCPGRPLIFFSNVRNEEHHRVRESFDASLKRLNCEYIDLYLVHWPQTSVDGEHRRLWLGPRWSDLHTLQAACTLPMRHPQSLTSGRKWRNSSRLVCILRSRRDDELKYCIFREG